MLRLRHRLQREREQSIVEDVRREIAAITERRAKTSAQATPGAMGLPEKAASAGREGLALVASGAGGPHKLPPACGPQENTDNTFHYTCPFCEAAVSSIVRSGQVDHRRHCGNRFQVKDGCVVTKKMVYQCPFCDGKVSSNVMTGQVNHGSVCGNRFQVTDGCVVTKKMVYQCPFCDGKVSSNVMTGQVNHGSVCGNRFQVTDGCVVTMYQCPFCDGKVSSNVMTGQVNHGSVCGSWFYVKNGKVSDATRKHMYTCPRCQAAVRVVSQRVGANPRAAQHTSGTPVHTEELEERGKERSIG